jgi:hypothetical protein
LELGEQAPFKLADLMIPTLLALQAIPRLLVDVRGVEDTLTVSTDEGNEQSKSNAMEADKVVRQFRLRSKEVMKVGKW